MKSISDEQLAHTLKRVLPKKSDAEIQNLISKAAARKRLEIAHPELFKAISSILFRRSPLGISYDGNEDEFSGEAGTIIPRLKNCRSENDVLDVVYDEFVNWFDGYAMKKTDYSRAAQEIWQAWTNYTKK